VRGTQAFACRLPSEPAPAVTRGIFVQIRNPHLCSAKRSASLRRAESEMSPSPLPPARRGGIRIHRRQTHRRDRRECFFTFPMLCVLCDLRGRICPTYRRAGAAPNPIQPCRLRGDQDAVLFGVRGYKSKHPRRDYFNSGVHRSSER